MSETTPEEVQQDVVDTPAEETEAPVTATDENAPEDAAGASQE